MLKSTKNIYILSSITALILCLVMRYIYSIDSAILGPLLYPTMILALCSNLNILKYRIIYSLSLVAISFVFYGNLSNLMMPALAFCGGLIAFILSSLIEWFGRKS